jgi:hypothetical protein
VDGEMMEGGMEKLNCSIENAPKFLKWLRERGGIAVWNSIDLGNPGASWSTPAMTEGGKPMTSPTWQADRTPSRVVTDPDDVVVIFPREVKRFYVAIRRGSGLSYNLTDASSRRLRKAVEKAGKDAWYEFDFSSQEAVIFVADSVVPILEWEMMESKTGSKENEAIDRATVSPTLH